MTSPPIELVILMAGEGLRFRGWKRPKPYVCLGGKSLFEYALESALEHIKPVQTTFVIQETHWPLFRESKVDSNFRVVALNGFSRGPADSARVAIESLAGDRALFVCDCDLMFHSNGLKNFIGEWYKGRSAAEWPNGRSNDEWAATILTFPSDKKMYSYANLAQDNSEVLQIAEKEVISSNAIAGFYGFRSVSQFLAAFEGAAVQGEFYISAVLQKMLRGAGRIFGFATDQYTSFGSPEELKGGARGLNLEIEDEPGVGEPK